MGKRLQLLLVILVLITLILVLRRVRTKKLLLQYTLSWMSLLFVLLIVSLFPDILEVFSHMFGIATPVNMVFFLGFCFALIIIFGLTQAVSKMSQQIKDLTQKVALMEKDEKDVYKK